MEIIAIAIRHAESQGQDWHLLDSGLHINVCFIRELLPADGMHGNLFLAMLQRDGIVIAVYFIIEYTQSAYEFIIDDVISSDILRIESSDVIGKMNAIIAVDVVQRKNDFRVAVLPSRIEDCIA